jgi:hypothetical protein
MTVVLGAFAIDRYNCATPPTLQGPPPSNETTRLWNIRSPFDHCFGQNVARLNIAGRVRTTEKRLAVSRLSK